MSEDILKILIVNQMRYLHSNKFEEVSGRLEEQEELGQGGSTSSRPPRQLRSRSVARSVKGSKTVKFHDTVECVELDQYYKEELKSEGEHTLFPSSQHQENINAMSREKWELLYDPTPSRALKRTRQQASIVAQQMLAKSHVSAVCLLDQNAETTGYTVLSDAITKKMDREERKYQKAMMICVQGIGASLNSSVEALDVVDGLGQSHHESVKKHKMGIMGKGVGISTYSQYTTMGFGYTTNPESSECARVLPKGRHYEVLGRNLE